jgi:MFS family permease
VSETVPGETPLADRNIFGLHPNIFFLGVVSSLTDISSEMIFTIISLFLDNVVGATTLVIGLIGGLADSADAILRVFSGWLSDRMGKRKPLALLGYGLSTLAKPFMYFATAWLPVLGIRLTDRLGKGIRTSPRDALIADSTADEKRGRSFGFHRAMDTSGAVIGLALAAVIVYLIQGKALELSRYTYQQLVWVGVIPAVLAVLVLLFFVRERREDSTSSEEKKPLLLTFKGFDTRFKLFLGIVALFTLGNSSDIFLILRAQNIGFSVFHILLTLVLFNVVYAVTALPAGILSDKFGRKALIAIGWSVYAIIYLGFALVSTGWQLWLLFALYGIYHGASDGVARAMVADMVTEERLGTAYGLYHGVVSIALLPASLIAGWLWQAFTPAAPFFFGAALAAAATLALLILIPRAPKTLSQLR